MKKTFMTLFLLSVFSLAVAYAQAPDQPQTDEQSPPSSSNMDRNVTVTGCLQQGTEPNSFVLYNVTPSDMSQQSYQRENDNSQIQNQARGDYNNQTRSQDVTPDTQNLQDQDQSGTTPSEMARTETSYTLIPDGRVDLKSHIGQRVEVSGKMSESSSRTNQTSRATTPSGQSSSMHSSTEITGQPQFKVSSIRQLSQSCQ